MAVDRAAIGVAVVAAVSALVLPGCSGGADGPARTPDMAPPSATADPVRTTGPGGTVGSGCAGYAQAAPSGPGSLAGMAADPVAVAVSNSPELTTLAGALSGRLNTSVNLTEILSKGRHTVFAPTDDAFGKLAPAVLATFRKDADVLTSVLKYHLVSGELDPTAVDGEQKTLQGQSVRVTTAEDGLRVNGAKVVCGGIRTADAIVYLVDTVLMPPAQPPSPTSTETTATPTP